jgi:hypothetical protein
LAVLPWLLPTRTEPWTTFYAEALTAAVWLTLALALVMPGRRTGAATAAHRFAIDGIAALALGLLGVILAQAALGQLAFGTEAILVGGYLAAFAGVVMLSRHCREAAGHRFTLSLWAYLLAAALLSAGIGFGQWLQVEPLGWLTPPADVDGRAIANVGQANNLATLLCWGLIGLWWACEAGHLGRWTALLVAAFLAFALALTQSRTPWVIAPICLLLALLGRRSVPLRRTLVALGTLVAMYVISWHVMTYLSETLGLLPPRDAADTLSAGFRPAIWEIALRAIAERPWLGWGWNQFAVAWTELAPGRITIPSPNGYAHNILLDLLVWNGVAIGGAVIVGLLWWLGQAVRAAHSSESWLMLAGLGVFGVHAMLELPHAYLLMLLPAAAMCGVLSATTQAHAWLHAPRRWLAVAAIGLASLLALVVHDYRGIEADVQALRLRDAGILARTPHVPSQPIVLRWMAEVGSTLTPRAAETVSAAELAQMRRVLRRYPSAGGLARYAQAAALRGDTASAAWALHTLCGIYRRHVCAAALREWNSFAATRPVAALVPLPQSRAIR